ncbi:MAG: ABC transporter permease subunit [Phototrophicaceae bacterium]
MDEKQKTADMSYMPNEVRFKSGLQTRQLVGSIWRAFFIASIIVAILALIVLFINVINSAFGSIATTFEIEPTTLTGEERTLSDLSEEELVAILIEREPNRLPVLVRDTLSTLPNEEFTSATLREVLPNGRYPDGFDTVTINDIRDREDTALILGEFLSLNLSKSRIISIVEEDIIALQVVDAWTLWDAINNYEPSVAEQARLDAFPVEIEALQAELATIEQQISDTQADVAATSDSATVRTLNTELSALQAQAATLTDSIENTQDAFNRLLGANITTSVERDFADSENPIEIVRYHSWIDGRFLQDPMSSVPAQAGIRTAFIGSIIMMVIVILVSLPIGVGAAIYLEEYAKDNILARIPFINVNKVIETNVRNLAGVPSIIYGMLGLAIFVRVLAPFTSGVAFGVNVTPPPTSRIENLLQEPDILEIQLELDTNYQITNFTGAEWLTDSDAQALVNLYRRLGTPSINNTGNISLERTEAAIADLFGVQILDAVPTNADPLGYERVAAGFIELNTLPMSVEQFEALGQQLRRITGFTVSGRTILSAALTLALLILPVIIINSQEALRAVPNALREASYGLGATKWQTIWQTVLPASIPGIMTGTILAVSRAVGETAPLIVVGASTFLLTDPTGPFSQFTVLPIQIFQWTARPQEQFQFIAAAAIIILLSLVLVLNAVAIIIRNRFSTRY